MNTYVVDVGKTVAGAEDLSAYTVKAYVPDGSPTGFAIRTGAGSADGSARVDGVADGAYLLELDPPGDTVIDALTADVSGKAASFTPFAIGNPYPSQWPDAVRTVFRQTKRYFLPGTTGLAVPISNLITELRPGSDAYTSNLPLVNPPGAIKVNGVVAGEGGAIAFDGTKPVTVTFTAVAGVSHYDVWFYRVYKQGSLTSSNVIATVDMQTNSVTVPAELFTKGEYYVFTVAAITDPASYPLGVLRRTTSPHGLATNSSGVMLLAPACGDHNLDTTYEVCDDGGNSATCDADCTPRACGDGFTNPVAGETCDDGTDSPNCDSDCTGVSCGDGHVNTWANEGCDDGDTNGGDGCSPTCAVEAGYTCTGSPSICTM